MNRQVEGLTEPSTTPPGHRSHLPDADRRGSRGHREQLLPRSDVPAEMGRPLPNTGPKPAPQKRLQQSCGRGRPWSAASPPDTHPHPRAAPSWGAKSTTLGRRQDTPSDARGRWHRMGQQEPHSAAALWFAEGLPSLPSLSDRDAVPVCHRGWTQCPQGGPGWVSSPAVWAEAPAPHLR